MKNSPCKECHNRVMGCHDMCLHYSEWKKEIALEKQYTKKEKERTRACMSTRVSNALNSSGFKNNKDTVYSLCR